jgi:hypothetical protein
MQTISAEEFKKRYGTTGSTQFQEPEKKPGYLDRLKESFKAGASKIKSGFNQSTSQVMSGSRNPLPLLEGGIKSLAGAAEAAFSPVTAVAEPILKPTVGKGLSSVADQIGKIPAVQRFADSGLGHATSRAAEDVGNLSTVAGAVAGTMGAPKVVNTVKTGVGKTLDRTAGAMDRAYEGSSQLYSEAKEAFGPPTPSSAQAMGQVLQGKSGDVKAGFKALKEVDTEGVKTYSDLAGRVDQSIKDLSQKVDAHLDKDPSLYPLNKLKLSGKTKQGQTLQVDYIDRAMTHLKELYTSTGDDIAAQNMGDLMKSAKINGLSRKQVNDLARQYGQEFSEKAFGRTGEPLTSVNAQKFENTRMGLKQVARQGLEGSAAEATDKTISNLYKVQKLVNQNVEAVSKLTQRIQERGLMEKLGHALSKTADTLSGGSLRGIVGGMLPRGVGYKVMNALDLEQVLGRNLKVIKDALGSGNDEALIKAITKISDKGAGPAASGVEQFGKKVNSYLNESTPGLYTTSKYTIRYKKPDGSMATLSGLDRTDASGWAKYLKENGFKFAVKSAGTGATAAAIAKGR